MKHCKCKRKPVWIVLMLIVLAGLAVWYQKKADSKSVAELTCWEGPSSCGFGDLLYDLPEGCTQEMRELVKPGLLEEKEGQYHNGIRFLVDGSEVGGVDSYYLPENPDWDFGHWVENLGLWEFEDETLGYSGGSSAYAEWEMEFFTDLPGGEAPAVRRYHYFFVSEDLTMAYDLWFDLLTVDSAVMDTIVQSCTVG